MLGKTGKSYYTEAEAARSMGVTIDELRGLIRRHIVDSEDDLSNCPKATYYPADLVVLKLLFTKTLAATNSR
ncbi:MAG: hypothetical protein ACRD44_18550 [Bryobacteraceae bacterium]